MPVVHLGNSLAVHHPGGERTPFPGDQVTTVSIPDGYTRQEAVRTVIHQDGVWAAHSDAPGPDWVESDDPGLAAALSAIYDCPIGRPEGGEPE